MNAERLLAHYAEIAEAPDAVAKLRRFVLDLAVRGKLVPQDANDEPASQLLARIAAEKVASSRSVSRGRRSEGRPRTGDFAFCPPLGWAVSTLGEVALRLTDGAHHTPTYVPSGIPFVSVKDFSGGRLDLSNTRFITPEEHRELYRRCDPRRGDIIFGRIGTLGKAVLVDTDIEFSLFVSVGLIRYSHANLSPKYFHMLLNSPLVEAEFDRIKIGAGTHTNKLNLGDLQTVALPLAPLAEQHRIVAKVEQLMALCDELEAARMAREAARDRLAAASLARLNTPDPEIFQADARFVLGTVADLTARPDQIKQLRQTILNLSVRGKLVAQDPDDEGVDLLLQRLGAARKRAGTQRAERARPVTPPFEPPAGWEWTTVQGILESGREISYGVIKLGDEPKVGGVPTLRCSDVKPGFIDLRGVRRVAEQIEAEYARTRLVGGEIVINIRGTLGGVAAVPVELNGYNVAREVAVVPVSSHVLADFFVYLMRSDYFWNSIQENLRGIAYKGLNLGTLREFQLPLPPYPEQCRIVAKVNELMAVCDELEGNLTNSDSTRRRLLDALLAEALREPAVAEAA